MSIKLAIKQSSEYMLFRALKIIVSLVSFPILTRTFSVEDYGDLSLANVTIALLVALVKGGVTSSFIRFEPEYEKEGNNRELYSTAFYGSIIVTIAILILYALVIVGLRGRISPEIANIMLILSLIVLFRHVENVFHGFFRVQLKVKTLGLIGLINRIGSIATGLTIYFLVMRSVFGFFIGICLFEFLLIYSVYQKYFVRQLSIKRISFVTVEKLYKFGVPLIFFEISYLILNSSDRYLIKTFLDSTQLGLYSVGYNFSYYFHGLLSMPVGMAIYPIYTKLWVNEGKDKTIGFLNTILRYYLCLAVFLIFLISVCGKDIIVFLASSKYEEAYHIIPFVISSVLLSGAYQITGAGFYLKKNTKSIGIYTLICALLNVALNFYFIPRFGIMGAAFTTFVSFLLLAFLITFQSNKILKIEIPIKDLSVYTLFAAVMALCIHMINFNLPVIVLVGIKLVLGSLTYASLMLIYDKEIRRNLTRLSFLSQKPAGLP